MICIHRMGRSLSKFFEYIISWTWWKRICYPKRAKEVQAKGRRSESCCVKGDETLRFLKPLYLLTDIGVAGGSFFKSVSTFREDSYLYLFWVCLIQIWCKTRKSLSKSHCVFCIRIVQYWSLRKYGLQVCVVTSRNLLNQIWTVHHQTAEVLAHWEHHEARYEAGGLNRIDLLPMHHDQRPSLLRVSWNICISLMRRW